MSDAVRTLEKAEPNAVAFSKVIEPFNAPVKAMVKWFDSGRGFGFVILPGSRDALLHSAVLRNSGISDPNQGDVLICRICTGPRGFQVINAMVALPDNNLNGKHQIQGSLTGKVKFYDACRGYGFICSDSGEEVFVGAKLLKKLGLTPLRQDQSVRITVSHGARGLVVETLTFV